MSRLAELYKGRSPDNVALELHRRWPVKTVKRPENPRTIGNRLRELEQGKNIEYWRKRPAVVHALARVLAVDDAELAPLLSDSTGVHIPTGMKFTAFGEFRPLALDKDALFPGLPEAVLSPESWTRHWWCVPDRLTRDLVARWHDHHQRAAVLRKPTWDDALPVLPRSGRVLVVLDAQLPPALDAFPRAAGMPPMVLAKRAEPSLDALHDRRNLFLCVLAPSPAYAEAQAAFGTDVWEVIGDLDPDDWIAELADWACERARPRGGLRQKSAQEQLPARLKEYGGWFTGPREALEICALLDEIGCGDDDERTLARRYLESLWREHDDIFGQRRMWLGAHGFTTLLAVVSAAIFHHGDAWLNGLPRQDWDTLVPVDALVGDVEGARELLRRGPLTEQMRAQLLARLDPGPQRLLEDLVVAGVLDRRPEGTLQIAPRWLAMCLRKSALAEMLSAPWDRWASNLAQPVFASAAVRRLASDLTAGDFTRLDQVSSQANTREYAHLLAIDTCVRGAGLARLRGADLPRMQVAGLWRSIGQILGPLRGGELPAPLFSGKDPLLGNDAFAVACLSLTEMLTDEEAGAFAMLWRPGWELRNAWAVVGPANQLFRSILKRPSTSLDGMLRLGARCLERSGPPLAPGRVIEFILPAWLVRELLGGATPEIWKYLRGYQLAIDLPRLMLRHCELAGLPFSKVIERAWRAWKPEVERGDPHPWLWWARDEPRQAALVWKYLPADVLRGHLRSAVTDLDSKIYPNAWKMFDSLQWKSYLQIVRETEELLTHHELVRACQFMPEEILLSALFSGLLEEFPPGAFSVVWARLGDKMLTQLSKLRRERPSAAWSLLRSVTEPLRSACLDLVLGWLAELDKSDASEAETFLRSCIATRGPLAPRAWEGLRTLATP